MYFKFKPHIVLIQTTDTSMVVKGTFISTHMVCFLFLLCLINISICHSLELPKSPERPTLNDCQLLEQKYYKLIINNNNLVFQCMKETPKFGVDKTCSGKYEKMAWVQCNHIDLKYCEIKNNQTKQVALCKSRALKNTKNDSDNGNNFLKQYNLIQSAIDKFNITKNFISNPKIFLVDKGNALLRDKAYNYVVSRIFRNGSNNIEDPELGSELYKTIASFNSLGLAATTNPLIKIIQQESFEILAKEYSQTFLILGDLNNTLKKFNNENKHGSINSTNPALKTQGDESDCALLEDESKSRHLQDEDSEQWMMLITKCNK